MWKFSSPNRIARNLLGKTQTRPQAPNYILSKMLVLSTFIQDSQSLCVRRTKNKTEGLPWSEPTWAANHAEGSGCSLQARKSVSTKPHSLPTSLRNTPAGIGGFWKWEWSFLILCLWVLLPYFLSQNSRCMTDTVVLMATKGQDILKILWKKSRVRVCPGKNTSFKRLIPQIFIWHLPGARHWW